MTTPLEIYENAVARFEEQAPHRPGCNGVMTAERSEDGIVVSCDCRMAFVTERMARQMGHILDEPPILP